jgi:hypothetical protein
MELIKWNVQVLQLSLRKELTCSAAAPAVDARSQQVKVISTRIQCYVNGAVIVIIVPRSLTTFFFFFGGRGDVLGFELGASHLLGRCSVI